MKRKLVSAFLTIFIITVMLSQISIFAGTDNTKILPVMKKPLATGFFAAFFIMADGNLYACGDNGYGQLGDGTRIAKTRPVKILDNAVYVDCAFSKNYAITANGDLYVWGSGEQGGNEKGIDKKLKPRKIMENVSSISASIQSCAIVGRNGDLYGIDGNDKITKLMSGVRSASASYGLIAAVKMDGSLWTWGENTFTGSLGDGTTAPGKTPRKILTDVKSVSCGNDHTLALKNDGTLWAWGGGDSGQLGYGALKSSWGSDEPWGNNRYAPVKIMEDVKYIDTCEHGSLAVKKDGSLWSWGINYYDEYPMNNGFSEQRGIPVKLLDNVSAASAQGSYMMAVKNDGTLWAWGDNGYGQFGNGQTSYIDKPVAILDNVKDMRITDRYGMALKNDGTVWGWGAIQNSCSEDGPLLLGENTVSDSGLYTNKPVQIMTGAAAIAAGPTHRLVLKQDGTLWAWGDNSYGKLGDGTIQDSKAPVKIMGGVKSIDAAYDNSSAISVDGAFYSWGSAEGQFGSEGMFPVKKADKVIASTSCGSGYIFVADKGTVYSNITSAKPSGDWKYYAEREIDAKNNIIGVHGNIVKIVGERGAFADSSYTFALAADGKLYGWAHYEQPKLIMEKVKDMSDEKNPYIVKSDGTLVRYKGNNTIMKNIRRVEAGDTILALDNKGTLYAWGRNDCGQVGNGTQSVHPVPKQYRSGVMTVE